MCCTTADVFCLPVCSGLVQLTWALLCCMARIFPQLKSNTLGRALWGVSLAGWVRSANKMYAGCCFMQAVLLCCVQTALQYARWISA